MKRMILMLIAGMGLSAFSDDEYRSFTDKEGREIKAKIVKADPRSGKVTIEREGSRAVTVPSDIFSAPDQAYIKEWIAAQNFLSNSKLRVSVDKRKGKAQDSSETKREKPPCYYEIKLDNKSGAPLEGIRVEYCMYINTENFKSGGDTLKVESAQSGTLKLPVQGSHLETTKEVKLYRLYEAQTEYSYDSYGNHDYSTSYNKTSEDNLEGIRVRIFLKTPAGNTFMREICEPSSVARDYVWKAPLAQTSTSGKKRNKRNF